MNMNKQLRCTSCSTDIRNAFGTVRFVCPNCNKAEIIRCSHCREIASRYKCECEFSGPN